MNWIHCNRCYSLLSESSEKHGFFMTSCGHIFCGNCTDGSTQKCLVQNNDCSYTLLSIVQRDFEDLFMNPSVALQKSIKIIDFQMGQYASLNSYLIDRLGKYNAQKQEIATLKSECKRHREEKNNLKNDLIQKHEEIKQLKKQVENLQKKSMNSQRNFFSEKICESQGTPYLFGGVCNNNQLSFSPIAQQGASQVFTPPKPVPFPKTYRDSNVYNLSTPRALQRNSTFTSPPSSDYSQRPNLRKVMLPGDKCSSPINRIGLQRLNLKCTPSFDRASQSSAGRVPSRGPRMGICNPASKYNKYF